MNNTAVRIVALVLCLSSVTFAAEAQKAGKVYRIGVLDPAPIVPNANLDAFREGLAELGYVDDSAFAMSRSHALAARGYGKRRLTEQLRLAGVADEDGRDAIESADTNAVTAALRFARRRRFGPFAVEPADRLAREKAMAAMVRAGHDFSLARKIVLMEPGELVDLPNLCESSQVDPA